jgi:hypothetical protein
MEDQKEIEFEFIHNESVLFGTAVLVWTAVNCKGWHSGGEIRTQDIYGWELDEIIEAKISVDALMGQLTMIDVLGSDSYMTAATNEIENYYLN